MEWALGEIHSIQKAARSGKPIVKPRWPVLILRTPKVRTFTLSTRLTVMADDASPLLMVGAVRRKFMANSLKAPSMRIKYL